MGYNKETLKFSLFPLVKYFAEINQDIKPDKTTVNKVKIFVFLLAGSINQFKKSIMTIHLK